MAVELGSEGYYVRAVQRVIGVPTEKVDGKCGPNTVAYLKEWQAKRGIDPDGVFGPLCRAKVDSNSFIQAYEGFVPQAYDDFFGPLSARLLTWTGKEWRRADGDQLMGNATVGWGTVIPRGREALMARCTREQADKWLNDYVDGRLAPYIVKYAPAGADAAQLAALRGLGYNGGEGAIIKLAQNGFAPAWWLEHPVPTNHPELKMRRREECALFYGGEP